MGRANTHLVYGESGTFKTTQVGFLAKYIWQKYHKKTRLISADGGGWFPIQPLVDAGIVEAFGVGQLVVVDPEKEKEIQRKLWPSGILRKLAVGCWPKQISETKVQLQPTTAKEWESIGAYAIEGLTSIADLLMEEMRKAQRTIGESAVGAFAVPVEGLDEEKFSANSRGHYGFVQKELEGLVRAFSFLPVTNVLFTAHEGKGEDEATKEFIRGPAICGKAVTHKVPTWVGDCIHADTTIVRGKEPEVRMWFVRHPDSLFPSLFYPAKLRIDPTLIAKVMQEYPGGYFVPTVTSGLDKLLELEERLTAEAAEKLRNGQ